MDLVGASTSAFRGYVLTCIRCGDNLAPDGSFGSGAMCEPCVQRLGRQALDRIAPVHRVLAWMLIGCAVVSAASCLSSVAQVALLERMQAGNFTQAEAEANDLRESAVGLLGVALRLAAAVAWCVWFRRSHAFVKVLDQPMEFGPNAWGWFFVPIANLFKPYQAVKELWQHAGRGRAVPAIFPAWWDTYLVSSFVGNAAFRASLRDTEGIPALISLSYVQAVDGLTSAVSGVTAYLLIRAFGSVLSMDAPSRHALR